MDKSSIHFSRNVSRQDINTLSHLMDIQECNHRGTYLGHPFCKFKSKCEAYKDLIEKLENKLVGWRQKCLSMAGQMVVIKTVAQAILNYITQTFLLPKNILHKMDSIGDSRTQMIIISILSLGIQSVYPRQVVGLA